jgi:subtilisin family serine protease
LRVALLLLLAAALLPASAAARGFDPRPPSGRSLETLETSRFALVQTREPLGAIGGTLVSRALRIWRVPGRLVPELVARGLVLTAEPVHPVVRLGTAGLDDPLVSSEWWRGAVGADAGSAPGPGKPVTVIDTGFDLSHPEFASRPNTVALNRQSLSDTPTDFHGTAVGSLVGAPANGVGIVGIYPNAILRSWDVRTLTNFDVIQGLDAASGMPGVINLSLGSTVYDPMIAQATLLAFGRGSIIVAASGNSFEEGNPLTFPASLSHVLTVAASNQVGLAAAFSSASPAVDLAAPGESIPVAVPLTEDPTGYASADGTSFAAPLVSGATAWIWTSRPDLDNTQIFDLMRFSAHDAGTPGFDQATGFGILDVPAALSDPALPSDGQEPNDDVFEIKPHGLFPRGTAPVTSPGHGSADVSARIDYTEDPEDVYRVWLPPRSRVRVSTLGSSNVDLELWGPRTRTVGERGAVQRRDLIALSVRTGTARDTVVLSNRTRAGRYVYADVFLGKGTGSAAYRLTVTTATAR